MVSELTVLQLMQSYTLLHKLNFGEQSTAHVVVGARWEEGKKSA